MSDYQRAVKTAEDAVASVKDQKLKEIAFDQILAHLLGAGKPPRPANLERVAGKDTRRAVPTSSKKTGTIGWLRDLATEGFFKTPRNVKSILGKLAEESHILSGSDLTWPLQQLCHDKILRRKKMASGADKAAVWHWSNW